MQPANGSLTLLAVLEDRKARVTRLGSRSSAEASVRRCRSARWFINQTTMCGFTRKIQFTFIVNPRYSWLSEPQDSRDNSHLICGRFTWRRPWRWRVDCLTPRLSRLAYMFIAGSRANWLSV